MRAYLFLFVSTLLAGCGPAVQSMTLSPERPASRPADHAIRIYRNTLPVCPFVEVGLVIGRPRWGSLEGMAERMRSRARRMGGDAIVGLSRERFSSGGDVWGISRSDSTSTVHLGTISLGRSTEFVGSVVRFTDPSCTGQASLLNTLFDPGGVVRPPGQSQPEL